MTVQRWRHLPVVKEVIEYDGTNTDEILEWADNKAYLVVNRLFIRTPQGDLAPAVGDFVVRGVEAELYPVPRSIFLGSYEPVGERP